MKKYIQIDISDNVAVALSPLSAGETVSTTLYEKKANWIDFNCGSMVEDTGKEQLAEELFRLVLSVASGRQVKSEAAGYHDMAIFKQGVTL